ncbi:MAG: hypothetical protein M0R77_02595 [Gammaproteobacteria bacterium]|nr:hypothetical protein [Gammaproteobacteria bacterium]
MDLVDNNAHPLLPSTEEQLSLFGESVLQLHDQIFQMVSLMNKQVEANENLTKEVQRLSNDVQMLINEKYRLESKQTNFDTRINMLEDDVYLKESWGGRSSEKLSDVVRRMKDHFDRLNDGRLTTSLVAMMEIFRLHLNQMDERDKAEIMSVMSSQQGYVENAYQLGLSYNPSELLRLVAALLDQPESIITLYK